MNPHYLSHSGVKGQKWYVRNYQTYETRPTRSGKVGEERIYKVERLTPEGTNKKDVKEKTNTLYNELDSWDYGVIINGKKYDETKLDKVNWKDYRTIPIDKMKKEKIGVCWDFVNYQHDFFKKNGIKDESYMMVMKKSDKQDDILTHTWSVFYNGNKKYWFEQSWYPKRGIREIKDYKDVVQELYKFHAKDGKDRPYDIYRYNPDGMDKGLTDQEYFNLATKDDPVYQKRIK